MKQTTFCAILLLATGCTSPKKTHTADPLRVGSIVVTPSSDIDAALYVGTIEEETSAALSFPVAGTVARTYADEGQRVQQGQLLAELDPTSARQTFDAAQAALDQAKDACARLKQLYDAESLPQIKWVEAQTRLRQAEAAFGIAKKNLEDCRRELKNAQDQVTASKNVISGFSLRQESRKKSRDDAAETLRQLSAQLDGISAKVRVFRAMERDYESYQKSVRMIMQEAQRGGLRNIHGPVSRLIRTENSYTVAIEIALGAAMQQIVVDSEADGKAAISYLKRTGGGRATFLPLSTIWGKSLQEPGVEKSRGFVGVAADLVSFDPKYRNIVLNLLGRTVIAEDIDAAIAMARQFKNRFRIVTLDGQVMNAGGSMTGGSVNKDAGILSRANELERLTAQEKQLLSQREAEQARLQECQRLFDQVEFQLGTARDQLREAEDQVLRLQGQTHQNQRRL